MKVAALLFVLMFLNYGLNAISFRMIARGSYLGTGLADAAIAAFGFWMISEVAHAQTASAFSGYVLGGVCGSLAGLWLTRKH
jgi:hypothetical protein